MPEYPGPRLVDVIDELGITYRQADNWCAHGYIRAEFYRRTGDEDIPARKGLGSGKVRRITWAEVGVLRQIVQLVQAGLQPGLAAQLVRSGEPPWTLTPGVELHLTGDHHDNTLQRS